MKYYDYSYLLVELGYEGVLDFDKPYITDEEKTKAKEFIKQLDVEAAIVIKEWLSEFAKLEYAVEADVLVAQAISKMNDDIAVLHYFSMLYDQFWA